MSLLKITTTPIEYEIKIERAKLQQKERDVAEIKREQAAQLRRQQTADYKADPHIVNEAQKAAQSSENYQSLARTRVVSGGVRSTTSAEITKRSGQSINSDNQIEANRMSSSMDIDFTSTLSFGEYENSENYVEKFDMSSMIDMSQSSSWNVSKKEMEYVPGRFQMEITQYPKVTIEYLGNQETEIAE